ncbi:TadE/TadG family type IV pilus assembly protein [Marivita sp. S2033]|uniref:TadE/TadG family type IV pilus assembly protein n=1 Tax=Marivita sp. S2033 TaxID=3373187 RepID=UPI003981CC52
MTRFSTYRFRRFLQSDDGTMTVPFLILLPFFMSMILATIELGMLTIRYNQLERALDTTVREVRLNTGDNTLTHDALKTKICSQTTALEKCEETLKLEMIKLDLRDWNDPSALADCVDTSAAVNPLRTFEPGRDNELMYLRACYKYIPKISRPFADSLFSDENGYTKIVSFSAFVQEPSS